MSSPRDENEVTHLSRVGILKADPVERVFSQPALASCEFVQTLGAAAKGVLSRGVLRKVLPGQPLYMAGQVGDMVYLVIDGQIRMRAADPEASGPGGVVSPGGLCGVQALHSLAPRPFSAVAAEGEAVVIGWSVDYLIPAVSSQAAFTDLLARFEAQEAGLA